MGEELEVGVGLVGNELFQIMHSCSSILLLFEIYAYISILDQIKEVPRNKIRAETAQTMAYSDD